MNKITYLYLGKILCKQKLLKIIVCHKVTNQNKNSNFYFFLAFAHRIKAFDSGAHGKYDK